MTDVATFLTRIGPGEVRGEHRYGLYRCVCGTEKLIRDSDVRGGRIKGCGCQVKKNGRHGRWGGLPVGSGRIYSDAERLQRARDAYRKTRYGVTGTQFLQLIATQGGLCRICSKDITGPRQAHLDHDHRTGRVRGILCQACNTGLGKFKDDPSLLSKALEYLNDGE